MSLWGRSKMPSLSRVAPRACRMTFFFDRSLGKLLPQAFQSLFGLDVVAHNDYFDEMTRDEVWLATAGQRG